MSRWQSLAWRSAAFVAVYLAASAFAISFNGPSEIAMYWPASGFAFAVVVVAGWRWALLVPLALVLKAFPREKLPVAVAVWGAVGALAGAIGPTVSALLVDAFSWRAVFYINVPVSLGVLIFGRRLLTESRESHPAASQ